MPRDDRKPPRKDLTRPAQPSDQGLLGRLRRRAEALTPGRLLDAEGPSLPGRALEAGRALVRRVPIEASLDAAVRAMTDPRAVALVQRTLTTLGNTGMEAAFAREPAAGLLFEYADWCEARAGRGRIMAILMEDALGERGGFHQLAGPALILGTGGDPRAALGRMSAAADRRTLERALVGVLHTLTRMGAAALEDAPPLPAPDAPASEQARALADLGLPPRFAALAALAQGELTFEEVPPIDADLPGTAAPRTPEDADPEDGDAPRAPRPPSPGPHERHARVPDAKAPDSHAEASDPREPSAATSDHAQGPAQGTALTRARALLPTLSLGPGHRFVLGPYLLFMQTWLTRNMVDALPNVMGKVREELDQLDAARDAPDPSEPGVIDMNKP